MRKLLRKLPAGITSALITVIVLYFSLSAHPVGAEDLMWFVGADKMWHFIMYFVVASVYYLDYAKFRYPHHTKLNGEAGTIVAAIVLGGVLEVMQGLSGKRQMDVNDFYANSLGAIAAFLFIKFYFINVFRSYFKHSSTHHHHHHHRSRSDNETAD